MTGTNLDRIAALEKTIADLAKRLSALENAQAKRDQASATNGSFTIRNTASQPTGFGFGTPGAYIGGASVDEDVRSERWRDAQS